MDMGMPIDVTVAIIKASWETRKSDALVLPLWSQSVLDEVFQSRNGWSLGSYWDQCSLGLRRFQFSFFSLGTLKGKQGGGREDVIPAARQQCKDASIPIEDYEHVIILVDPSNNDSGALGIGGDALFDQNGSHEFFAHELGHVLGLDHPFGYQNGVPTEYQDYYCLMGYTGPNSATLPRPTDPKGSSPRHQRTRARTISGAPAACHRPRPCITTGATSAPRPTFRPPPVRSRNP
jgi:hypothetical protein